MADNQITDYQRPSGLSTGRPVYKPYLQALISWMDGVDNRGVRLSEQYLQNT